MRTISIRSSAASAEDVDGASCGGQALENVRAVFIGSQAAKNALELADDFFGAVDEIKLFSGRV